MDYIITIVVPIYNVEEYLEECIESILRQSYKDYEVILVDDGSTDQSGSLAERYAESRNHFTVLHKENGGISSARNMGIQRAQGKYICFVDADDILQEDYLQQLYLAAEQKDADMVFCDYYETDQNGQTLEKAAGVCPYSKGMTEQRLLLRALTIVGANHYATAAVVAWNKLVKTGIMKTMPYPEGVLHEDEFIIMPLLLKCSCIVWVDKKLYGYRQRKSGIMQSSENGWRHLAVLDAYEHRIKLAEQHESRKEMLCRFACSYFDNMIIWYYTLQEKYKNTSRERGVYFFKRMWKGMFRYGKYIEKRKLLKCILFSFLPRMYYKHYY